jgi:hypothetical protein
MTITEERLRFAVLLEKSRLKRWQADCVSRIVNSDIARLDIVIRVTRRERWSLQRMRTFVRYILWYAFRWTLGRSGQTRDAKESRLQNIAWRTGFLIGDETTLKLEDHLLSYVRSKEIDVILYFGERTPSDNLMQVTRYGVWSFKFGDSLSSVDAPLAVWESMRRNCLPKAELRRFSLGVAPVGVVLRSGYFSIAAYSYRRTITQMLRAIGDFPLLACRDLVAGRVAEPATAELGDARSSIGRPGNAAMLLFATRMFCRKGAALFQAAFTRTQWNTGVLRDVSLDPGSSTVAKDVCWLPMKGPKDYAADPFFIRRDDDIILLIETLDRTNNRGKIAARQISNGRIVPLGVVIEEKFHLSYPCLVQWQGQIYCVPEQAEANSIMLYRAVEFPTRWECLGPLLDGIEAVDSTLFRYCNYWWLAYTDASMDRNGRLMLWYATDLKGPWTPHALNPVKIDPRCSRGAGPAFFHHGVFVRPSQDCSISYGAKIKFNRVIVLTPTEFREEVIGELKSNAAGPYPLGLHTISSDGTVTVIDGKRLVFDPTAFIGRLRGRLRLSLLHMNRRSKIPRVTFLKAATDKQR